MDAMEFIGSLCSDHPELNDWGNTLSDLYQRKLWHQLTINLEQFFFLPVLHTDNELIHLYDNFIIHFETKINPLKLAQFAAIASTKYLDSEAAINFLKERIEMLNSTNQMHTEGPILFINMQIAALYLGKGDNKECKNLIDSGKTTLDSITDVDTSVYTHYYWVTCQYHWTLQDPVEFYKNAIRYLAYVSEQSLLPAQKQYFAFYTCLAAMLGDSIYDFGELLAHPIIKSLLGSEYEWIYMILEALNSGNLVLYQELCTTHKTLIDSYPALVEKEKKLLEKISIRQLMEFIFRLLLKERTIPFTTIAEHLNLTVKDVENLLLKILSGMLDEVDGTVDVLWVHPRVLGMSQVEYLRHRLARWSNKVEWIEKGASLMQLCASIPTGFFSRHRTEF